MPRDLELLAAVTVSRRHKDLTEGLQYAPTMERGMTNLEKLRQARNLLGVRKQWCRGGEARNEDGEVVNAGDDGARQWCLLGACWRYGADPLPLYNTLNRWGHGVYSLVDYNDRVENSHEDILVLFDHTIKFLEQGR